MIEHWWAGSGLSGVIAEEYPIVAKSGPTQRRRADAVAIIDSASTQRAVTWREQSALAAKDTVVLQAKASPLCAPLAGQAISSLWLVRRHRPASVRSILLCTADDPVLRPLVEGYGVEVVVMPEFAHGPFARAADHDRVTAWHAGVGGTLWRNVALTKRPSALRAHGLHTDHPDLGEKPPGSLDGLDVTVVTAVSRQPKGGTSFGMYAFGMALLYRDLARQRGAATVRSTILTETTDPTIAALCADFGIEVEEVVPDHPRS